MTGAGSRAVPIPAHLEGLERYEPGRPIEEVQRELGLERVVKLASNENPLGPSPRAVEALRQAAATVNRYPDGPARALRGALARRLGVEPSMVAIGNGSTDLIDLLARAFLGADDDAVVSEEAFARFRQVVRARNGRARLVPAREHTHDLTAMVAAAAGNTRLLFVANPNNPTGTWNRREEVDRLLERLPPRTLLVLDEAYYEYAHDPGSEPGHGCPDALELVRAGAPVVALRTFSKVYGLAGLRVGYAAAAPEVIAALDTIREPFNSNSLAQVAALAALEDPAHVERSLALNREQRSRLRTALGERGLPVLPSLTNFLCVDTRRDAAAVFEGLLRHGVIVRPLRAYGLTSWLRISIGTAEENDAFLAALDAVLAGSTA